MLREYLLGLSLIEYTIIHSAPLQEMCGARKVPVLSLSREVKQAPFFIVRLAAHVSNGCKSRIRPVVGRI